jgi:exosome complex component RRP41
LDGRRVNELRSLAAEMGISRGCEGSASFSFGNTRVLATVNGPRELNSADANANAVTERGNVSIKIHAASFASSGGERRSGTGSGGPDRRLLEWSRWLTDLFSTVLQLETFPRSQVNVHVEIVNADGGVLAAAANAVCLALMDAGVPMSEYVVASEVALLQSHCLLDPNRLEESAIGPILQAAVLPRSGRFVFAETEGRVAPDSLASMCALLKLGASRIFQFMDESVVRPHLHALLESKSRTQ